MTIINVGMIYRTGPIELLERLVVDDAQAGDVLGALHAEPSLDEVMLLSTCNRVEIYANTADSDNAVAAVIARMAARADLSAEALREHVTVRHTAEAVEHLLTVACGLDSMAVGEDQIVAQIRAAFRQAQRAMTAGPVLSELVAAALHTSRRARTETRISVAGRSLVHVGLELGRKALGPLAGRTALLIGSGTVGALAGRLLRQEGVGRILVTSRTHNNAVRLARAVGVGEVVALSRLPAVLEECEIVVASTAAPDIVLSADQLRGPRERAGHPPLFVLDLAMPRDIDPACRAIRGVTVVDIDALGRHLGRRGVPADVEHVRGIVAEEAPGYLARRREAAVAPLVVALRSRVREDVERELNRLYHRLPDLGAHERATTAAAVHRIVGKVLHTPTVRVKEFSTTPEGRVYLEAFSRLFDIDARRVDA